MSGQANRRSRSRGRRDSQESSDPVEPVVAQKPDDEQPQQEEPPSESQDIEPGQEREDEGTPAVEELGPEIAGQGIDLEKTGGEHEDGPDERGKTPSDLKAAKIPEAGDKKP